MPYPNKESETSGTIFFQFPTRSNEMHTQQIKKIKHEVRVPLDTIENS